MPRPLIIDSDVGVDDVTAILLASTHSDYSAHASAEALQLEAITVVDGNVSLPAAYQCAKTVMAVADVPESHVQVVAGAEGPLIPGLFKKVLWEGHGTDGLGGFTSRADEWNAFCQSHIPNHIPESLPENSTNRAAIELVTRAAANPGTLTLLALGPLTNVALAISLDKNFLKNLKSLVIMGGSIDARGNSSRVSEFNFHCDPEAAHIVFHAAGLLEECNVTLIPWETTLDHALPWTFVDYLLGRVDGGESAPSKLGAFLGGYVKFAEDAGRPLYEKASQEAARHEQYHTQLNGFLMCDIYAAVCVIDPSCILDSKKLHVHIELGGQYSRGMLAIDWNGWSGAKPNCNIVFKLDTDKIKGIFEKTFK
ncbi:nucleoside hydrolase [Rhizoclosmatium globosum]|uniref:Nucleoside hydrolase n=1 Tax=Rhizoclosmatium globosum TaxID=329046 RepID=A0A1Y2CUX2_9FUNG|nr:nucleoside hydrolase [Rhizoclosmatium globosum]|eukprot:ORY50841.1 nucleoside hydrolase [Rhizoclosmatium globosum]